MKFEDLVEQTVSEVIFFRDILNEEALFAEFTMGSGVTYFDRLESRRFKAYIRMKSRELTNGTQVLEAKPTIEFIRDFFLYEAPPEKVDVYIRTAGDLEEGIEYALKDDNANFIQISKNGWKAITTPCHKFLQPSTSKAQVMPQKSDKSPLKLLKPYVNLVGDEYILFVIWLIQAFCSGNHSALLVTAERGSGKSTLSRLIRAIIDPSGVDVSQLQKKRDELLNHLSNLYLVCFDNVRDITTEQSDILCSAITGGTATKRALYTDNDLCVQKLHNTIVINGISVIPKESDLAERFLIVNLKKFTAKNIKREKDFWKSFYQDLPFILGSIFDTLSTAMLHVENLSSKGMPRMADAFTDMLAIARALGISEEEFRRIYDDNVERMHKLRADTPLVEAIRDAMNADASGRRSLDGKAERIYSIVKAAYSGNPNDLPGSASHFSRALEAEHDVIFAAGYRVNINDLPSDGTHIQIIRKKA